MSALRLPVSGTAVTRQQILSVVEEVLADAGQVRI
jgi:hypothetical protein